MKFITVRDLRTTPAQIWKDLPKEQEMIITNNGKPIALLTPMSDRNLEETISAIRQARAISAVQKIQLSSIQKGTEKITQKEIETEIREERENQ